jgi:pyrroline-5-carboxylate reductase
MRIEHHCLGFIGFGHMAQIIFRQVAAARILPHSRIFFHRRDPAKARQNEKDYSITSTSLHHLVERCDLLLLCVRPLQVAAVMQELQDDNLRGKMLVSILAGVTLSALRRPGMQVVRVMPNIASSVGQGMNLLACAKDTSIEFRSCVQLLFSPLGQLLEIDEQQMNICTGMAGSGPAFVLELIEAMAQLGVQEGMSYDQALKIAAQTFLGSASLVLKGTPPSTLLAQIATEGGTTLAGLKVLHQEQIPKRLQSTIIAAANRAKELSS